MQQYPGAIGAQPVAMGAVQAEAGSTTQHVVLGIPISDEQTAALAWRVMIVSGVMVLLAIVQAVFAIRAEDYSNIYVLLAFAIPICGWAGAKYNKPQLLRMFWVCNGLLLVVIVNLAITVPNINCLCDDACFEENMDTEAISEEDRAEICDDKVDIMRGIYLSLGVGAVGAILQGLGCQWGKQLEESNMFVEEAQNVPVAAVIGHPIQVRQQPPEAQAWPPAAEGSEEGNYQPDSGGNSQRAYPQPPPGPS